MVCFICGVFSLTVVNEKTPNPRMDGCLFVSSFVGQRWPKATFVPKRYLCFPLRKGSGVELVGFEPTSKQGNHTLSTRLFQPFVFVWRQDLDHQPAPYPLNFTRATRLARAISDFPAPLNPWIRNHILGAMSRRITWWRNKASDLLCFDQAARA